MTRFYLMYPKLGAAIVWGSVVLMTAAWLAGMAGCNVLPVRAIEVNVRITT